MTVWPLVCAAALAATTAAGEDNSGSADTASPEPIAVSAGDYLLSDESSLGDPATDFSTQALAGFSSGSSLGPVADFDYELINLRGGVVLFPDQQGAFLPKGDVTCLLDVMIADPQDFGSIVAGPSILLRKDLRPSTAGWIPYAQAGGGMVYTDTDNDHTQRIIGRSWEFLLQAGLGCHFRISKRWLLDVEGSYQHISNARLASRNWGANNFGVVVGFTRTWGPSAR